MKLVDTGFEGLQIIEVPRFGDQRGFFSEQWSQKKFEELGLNINFVQDNHSFSRKNVVRGLHLQHNPSQGKLVYVTHGEILDVAVDMRRNSKTLGQYFSVVLGGEIPRLLWIPEGFAHGFSVLSEAANVVYKVDNYYSPAGEVSIRYNDPEINVDWRIEGSPILSDRDATQGVSFAQYKEKYLS